MLCDPVSHQTNNSELLEGYQMSDLRGTRSAKVVPQASAQLIQAATRNRTIQDLWIVKDCPFQCGGVHRHNNPGLRVSACGHLYCVVRTA